MMFHLDIQTLLIIILICLLVGILVGASLTRPRYSSHSTRWGSNP